MKYTQGNWTVKYDTNVFCGNRLIASCGGYQTNVDSYNTDLENEANAHLVASAPAMLEALQLAAKFIDEPVQMIDGEWCTMSETEVLKAILDAIAMAKGVDNDTI